MNSTKFIIGGASLLSLATGTVAGYFIAKKRLEKHYREEAEKEVKAAKYYYSMLYKATPETSSPEAVLQRRQPGLTITEADGPPAKEQRDAPSVEKLEKVLHKLQYGTPDQRQPDPRPVIQINNVFDRSGPDDPNENHVEEVSARNTFHPYVISYDEFTDPEVGYSQVTLTYYEGDNTLTDEDEDPVDNIERYVGLKNLEMFGHRSHDPNVVYIRNDRVKNDFEVIRRPGKYSEEVAGL